MAVLVVVALFWGNCFSCPQLLLSLDKHGCCHRTKAPKGDCQSRELQTFVKAEKAVPAAIAPVSAAVVVEPPIVSAGLSDCPAVLAEIQHAPPATLPLRI